MNILLKIINNKEYVFILVNYINLNLLEKLNCCLSINKNFVNVILVGMILNVYFIMEVLFVKS